MITDLREAIDDIRADGRSRTIRCPAHDDRSPSLSVGLGDHECIVLKCHAGCENGDVLAAAGLHWNDLRQIVAAYDYTDEYGMLLCQNVRFSPKGFACRRPNGAGGWIWNIKGVRRTVYRLDTIQGQSLVYLPEGEKDVDCLRRLGLGATCNISGAEKWHTSYTQQLVAAGVQRVIILEDNDDPGRAHAGIVERSCRAGGLQVRRLALPGLPEKGDISDWVAAGHTREELEALAEAPETPPASTSETSTAYSLSGLESIFAQWIKDGDPVPTRAALCAYVANRKLDSDPIWLMLVGGSGVGKTERLIPLAVMPDVVLESSITGPAALLSGTAKKEKAKDATGGLLRKIPDGGGVLILKDFTSIIDMHRDARAEVLAALREIYDGRWDRSVGTDGGRTLTWQGRLGLLAGCTTAIDSAHSVISTMGTRFLFVRLQGDADITGSAFIHVGDERTMRQALRTAVQQLLTRLPGQPYDKHEIRTQVIALAQYVALARSPVDRDMSGEIRLVLDPEAPTRIVKMLVQLWRAAGLLGLERTAAFEMVRRVGLDSIPKLRRAILDHLAAGQSNTTQVATAVEHPTRTTRRGLEDLTAHRMVLRTPGGEGKADLWTLAPQAITWRRDMTLPVSSGSPDTPTPNTSSFKHQHNQTDKTGKVPQGTNGSAGKEVVYL